MTILFSTVSAITARHYYQTSIADRSARYNVIYKALYLLEYCRINNLAITHDLWRRPEDVIEDIIRGLVSGEKNSRRAGNHGSGDYFARLHLELDEKYQELLTKQDVITDLDVLSILVDILPGADADLKRHSGELI